MIPEGYRFAVSVNQPRDSMAFPESSNRLRSSAFICGSLGFPRLRFPRP